MKLVVIESPFAGGPARGLLDALTLGPLRRRLRNVRYARAAVRDSLSRGEAPIASHLLYTQRGILRDDVPAERTLGIEAGLAWTRAAEFSAIYTDVGLSSGVRGAIHRADESGRAWTMRRIPGWKNPWWCRG